MRKACKISRKMCRPLAFADMFGKGMPAKGPASSVFEYSAGGRISEVRGICRSRIRMMLARWEPASTAIIELLRHSV